MIKCDLHETLQVVNSILQVKLPYTFLILASFNLFEFFGCHFGEGSIVQLISLVYMFRIIGNSARVYILNTYINFCASLQTFLRCIL